MYLDYKSQTFDDQGKFYLPWNPITTELRHDMRLVISMPQREPWTYKITKVKNTSPKGIITFTVKQDRYEPEHDGMDEYGDVYTNYKCYSDYSDINSSDVPSKFGDEKNMYKKYRIVIDAPTFNVKLGNYKILTAKVLDANDKDITCLFKDSECIWDFELDNVKLNRMKLIVIDEEYSLKEGNKFKCKFKFDGDEQYLNNNITVICKIDDMTTKVLLDVVNL